MKRIREIANFFANLKRDVAFESARTVFGIMGAAGYAGYLASMRALWTCLSISMLTATWYAVYRMME